MNDGSYYAKGRTVFKSPIDSATGTTMGFAVCDLRDGVSEDGAQEIADALNRAANLERIAELEKAK